MVTGGGSGIGRALVERFAAEGMTVAIGDLDGASAEAVAASIDAPTMPLAVDVSDGDQVQAFADRIFDELGQVDVLCNNAGVFIGGFLWERPAVDLEFVLGVNLWGILHGIRAFVPRMIAQDTEGHIVNTASVAGLFGSPYSGPYGVSKFAAFAAAETLAHDLAVTGSKLTASVLCPGMIRTPIAEAVLNREPLPGTTLTDDQAFVNQILADVVATGIDPSHVADCVLNGIRDETFLILSHPHHAGEITKRAQHLAALELPPIVDYT